MVPTVWPDWWEWELRLTVDVELPMEERDLDEVGLREIMAAATGFSRTAEDGRFVVYGSRRGRRWHVVVEPDSEERALVVVAALPAA